jgi:hypothetical protein
VCPSVCGGWKGKGDLGDQAAGRGEKVASRIDGGEKPPM